MNPGLVWLPSWGAGGVLAIVAVAAVLAALQYARRLARGPAAFRGVALGLLAVTALRPTVRYDEPASSPRPVRVVVDDSLSMGVIDGGRSPGRRLRLMAALGEFDDTALPRPLHDADALRGALDAFRNAGDARAAARQADPIAGPQRGGRTRDAAAAAVRNLLASARQVGCSAATLDAIERADEALVKNGDVTAVVRALDAVTPDLRLRADAEYERAAAGPAAAEVVERAGRSTRFDTAVAAARRLRAAGPGGAVVTTLDGRETGLPDTLKPDAATTPLTSALRDACVRAAAEGADAVVLLSDGRSTEPRSLLATAAATGVAVFPVNVAPDDRSPDVRVTRVSVRSAVLAGQPVPVRVRVSQRNAAGRPARVVVSDGRREVARAVTLGGDGTYDFTWPDARPPRLTLTARVDALDGETRLRNNAATTATAVIDRRERVLVVAGAGSRDVAECRDALAAVSWADVKSVTPEAGRPGAIDAAAFDAADLIVLADVAGDAMPDAAWEALGRAVTTDGKSLVVLAGQGDWLADAAIARRLASLLPTTAGPRPVWTTPPQKVWPVPTQFGFDTPYLRADESADASLRVWLGRPKLSRLLAVGPPRVDARTLLSDHTTQAPVIVEAAAGVGRVVLMLTDEAWQWATADAPDATKRFWQDLAQSVVDLPYDVTAGVLSLSVEDADVPAGRPVRVRVRTADPAAGPATLAVSRGGVVVASPPLREMLPGGGRWAGQLNLPAGAYEVSWRQARQSVRAMVTVRTDAHQEWADTTPDPALLQRIADATGGVSLAVDDLGRLPELLARQRERATHTGTYELWCGVPWFGLIVACLGLEWALRPRAGLA